MKRFHFNVLMCVVVSSTAWEPVRRVPPSSSLRPEGLVRRMSEWYVGALGRAVHRSSADADSSVKPQVFRVFQWPVTVQELNGAAGEGAEQIFVQIPDGVLGGGPLASIDQFLTPRFEWRGRFDLDPNRPSAGVFSLSLQPPEHVPLLKELARRQFLAWQGSESCNASVSVSNNFLGSGLEGDLGDAFMRWIHGDRSTAFTPIWQSGMHRPFCDDSSAADNSHQCFFLPVTSCTLSEEQWETIKEKWPGNSALFNQMIKSKRSLVELPYLPVVGDTWPLWNLLYYRMNSRTLQEIAIREHAWRQQNPSWPAAGNGTCVAMHVRHGDKITPFWKKLRHAESGNSGGFDRSLDEYIDEAMHLLNTNGKVDGPPQILVMSDDSDIIDDAIESKRAVMYHVEAGRPLQSLSNLVATDEKGRGFHYEQDNSDSMLQYILTVRLMSVCDYFAANLDSGFSKFIFYSSCAERSGSCPSAVTLGKYTPRPSVQFHVNVSPPQVVQPAGESTG